LKKQPINFSGIELVDAKSIDGMSILAFYEKLESNEFPLLITVEEQILTNAIPIKTYINVYNNGGDSE
jgi:hypothetical protein